MIEFALLFGLGFLSATLLAMLVAPSIHRRIVHYTENRLKATMPISPAEVRAQRDMARAVYAAENARTTQELAQEREKNLALRLRDETISADASRLHSENQELRMQIEEMNVEAASMRSKMRREDNYILQLKDALHKAEEASIASALETEQLNKRIYKLISDIDNLRIDLATRDAEAENFRLRISALRDERDSLRQDIKLLTKRAKDAEMSLTQETHKLLRLEDKLNREIAGNADRETTIERRMQEIARLKDKLKAANAENREASRVLRAAGVWKQVSPQKSSSQKRAGAGKNAMNGNAERLTEDLRNQSAALTERLLNARSSANDEALRQEMADVAAKMVALTADIEGEESPIHGMLSGKAAKGTGDRLSLATRARNAMKPAADRTPDTGA